MPCASDVRKQRQWSICYMAAKITLPKYGTLQGVHSHWRFLDTPETIYQPLITSDLRLSAINPTVYFFTSRQGWHQEKRVNPVSTMKWDGRSSVVILNSWCPEIVKNFYPGFKHISFQLSTTYRWILLEYQGVLHYTDALALLECIPYSLLHDWVILKLLSPSD
jgi:hypothetical protein